ncbi:hypothetical protein LQZ19_09870 [Treponema primitia]|uniref:hypothetical protein n=1 Tax=Treponema primitia TaxID=88058 RepID=UPI00397EE5C7
MKHNWQEVRLGDVSIVKGGKRLPNGINLVSTPNSHPYIRIRDLTNIRNLEITEKFEYVDIKEYEKIRNPMDTEIHYLCNENLQLSIIRDALLPKLISGEIAVPEENT